MIEGTLFDRETGEMVQLVSVSDISLLWIQADDERGVVEGHWDRNEYRVENGKVVKK